MANIYKDSDKRRKVIPGGAQKSQEAPEQEEVMPVPSEQNEQPAVAQPPEKPVESAPAVQPEPVVEPNPAPAAANSFAELYASQANFAVEPRNVRIQIVVTQTTAAKLDKLVQERKVRSKNDLMNFLLEGYLANVK